MALSFENARVVLAIAVLATGLAAPAGSQPVAPVDTSYVPGGEARAVARAIGGIVSYTRWPTQQQGLRLCVTGTTRYTARFAEISAIAGRAIAPRPVAAGGATTDCEILYLGEMAPDMRLTMIRSVHGRAVLSIAESDPQCRSGAMVCLRVRATALTFQLNLDAVSRSTVRVDPRVLLVASGGGA